MTGTSGRSAGRVRGRPHPWLALTVLFLLAAGYRCPREVLAQLGTAEEGAAGPAPHVDFQDATLKAQLFGRNVFGLDNRKDYILETTGNGVALFDYNNDGWPDIFLVNGSRLENPGSDLPSGNYLYRNNRDGTFSDVSAAAGVGRAGWGQGACVGDIDNDGFDDLFVTYFGTNVLYRNQGNGRFEDVTKTAGLAAAGQRWGTGCAFLDFDRDGDLDLYVSNYVAFDIKKIPPAASGECRWKGIGVMCGPRGLPKDTNLLYRNNGDGTFTDVSFASGITKAGGYYSFGVVVSDVDNDGWPDLYVACDSTPNILYRNQGNGTFEDIALAAGAAVNEDGREQAGMGVTAGDYNNDGLFDFFVTNFSDDLFTLYRNEGDALFTDATFEADLGKNTQYLGWGTSFFDFDNDGWKDVFAANGHVYPEVDVHPVGSTYKQSKLLYWNVRGKKFLDVSPNAGPAIRERRAARGAAVGDLDNDGRLEIVVSNLNDVPSLLVNRGKTGNAAVIRLVGTKSNRDAIAARVYVSAGGLTQVDEVRSGGSYMSHSDFRLHFGVGDAKKLDRVKVQWPTGRVEEFSDVEVNAVITVVEGRGITNRAPLGKGFVRWH